jgi:hypothetical protein
MEKVKIIQSIKLILGFISLYFLGDLLFYRHEDCINYHRFVNTRCVYQGIYNFNLNKYISHRKEIIIIVLVFIIALIYLYLLYDNLERHSYNKFKEKNK